jgi:hypothetical protein
MATMKPELTHCARSWPSVKVVAHVGNGHVDDGGRHDGRHGAHHHRQQQQPAVALAVAGAQLASPHRGQRLGSEEAGEAGKGNEVEVADMVCQFSPPRPGLLSSAARLVCASGQADVFAEVLIHRGDAPQVARLGMGQQPQQRFTVW